MGGSLLGKRQRVVRQPDLNSTRGGGGGSCGPESRPRNQGTALGRSGDGETLTHRATREQSTAPSHTAARPQSGPGSPGPQLLDSNPRPAATRPQYAGNPTPTQVTPGPWPAWPLPDLRPQRGPQPRTQPRDALQARPHPDRPAPHSGRRTLTQAIGLASGNSTAF